MTTGRTTIKHCRFYAGGYDLSGYTRGFGPLEWKYDEEELTTLTDSVKGFLPGRCTVTPRGLNGVLDGVSGGMHEQLSGAGASQVVMALFGIQADPAQGDPMFCGEFEQQSYEAAGDGAITVNMNWGIWDGGSLQLYDNPWGMLLAAKAARTEVNASTGVDGGAASSLGGYMVYQLFSSDGTVNLKVQDASSNSDVSFGDLAASGLITGPAAGLVELGTTAAVKQYLRWQMALGTASTATFAIGFVRETRVR